MNFLLYISMDVVMSTTWEFTEVGVSVVYDNDDGLQVMQVNEWLGLTAYDGTKSPPRCNPVGGVADSGGILQSFDCATPVPSYAQARVAAGTYRLGTIIWDTSGTTQGSELITALSPYVTAVINGNVVDVRSSVVLGSHILTIVFEPGAAAVLGLGLVGLILTARRRRG